MTNNIEVERSIIKTYRSKIWAPFVKAIKEYQMLKENDHVCVCISGGKDSMLLAKCFQELHRHSDFPFKLSFLVMNPGYNQKNIDLIKHNLQVLNIEANIVETNIFDVANKEEKNPCYLCARMRRGALYRISQEMGCNKIALGHHYDDVIETTLMNMLNAGSFQTMLPKLHSDNFEGMELIRPLYLVREKDIIRWMNHNELTFLQCACKFTENTSTDNNETNSQRKKTKKLINDLLAYNKLVEKNIFSSAENVYVDRLLSYKKDGVIHSFLDEYESKK